MLELENDALKNQVLLALSKAPFGSLTTSELSRKLESMPRKIRRAALDLHEEGIVTAVLTNDFGRPEYRYFLMAPPKKEEAPVEEPQEENAPWYRRVLNWFK